MSDNNGNGGTQDWTPALTLIERLGATGTEVRTGQETAAALERASLRLNSWRAQPPFNGDEAEFNKRLAAEHLDEPALLNILAEARETLYGRLPQTPSWAAELERLFNQHTCARERGADDAHECGAEVLASLEGYLKGLTPLIVRGLKRVGDGLRSMAAEKADAPFDPATVPAMFLPGLLAQLNNQAIRTLVLEVNVARLYGRLEGGTPEERYESFRRQIAQPEAMEALLKEYPVLAREAFRATEHWVNNSLELIGRLGSDWQEIKDTFSPRGNPGRLTGISMNAGDGHCEGRSVRILEFESGFKLAYKPHSLSVDVHFNELLAWLNARGAQPSFRTLKVINRGGYGWQEFVPHQACVDEGEVHRFYRRQGGLLALLYAIEATDFHYENLIASGEYPVLIDLESLFHPRVDVSLENASGLSPANNAISNSVLRVGLLPRRIWGAQDDSVGLDLSGLGGAPGQMTPFNVLTYEKLATDEMRAVRKPGALIGSQNRPSREGAEIDLQDHADDVVAGFRSVYDLLLRERDRLLAEDGPLTKFADDEVRVVMRPTRIYATLLSESFHPNLLRDSLDRQPLFDRLWGLTKVLPDMSQVVPFEIRDLQQGDIPYFSSRPNSRNLLTSCGQVIKNFLGQDGLSLARERFLQLNEEDASRQCWFVAASIATMSRGFDTKRKVRFQLEAPAEDVTRERLLDAARRVGDRLIALAVQDDKHVNWIGITFLSEDQWTLLPLIDELYNGTAGVIFFMAYAGEILGDDRFTEVARKAFKNLLGRLESYQANPVMPGETRLDIGGYTGIGSFIYLLTHLGALWRDPTLWAQAGSLVETLPPLIESDSAIDILSGSAGCILSLLALHRCSPSARTIEVAELCARRIISRAETDGALGWSNAKASRPLTGFSHGAAGIAHALLELESVTGDGSLRRAAAAAVGYERRVFSPEEGNWPDYRELAVEKVSPGDDYMITWCHGAPGIGLGRLSALRRDGDEATRSEVTTAVETTLRQGFGFSHSLCHGDLGNLEFLFEAAETLGDAELHGRCLRILASVLNSADEYGWMCGTPKGIETPGLMPGLAGIGYELLRLADRARVPSVLTLEPPQANSTSSRM